MAKSINDVAKIPQSAAEATVSTMIAGESPKTITTVFASIHLERNYASAIGKASNVTFENFCQLMPTNSNCTNNQIVSLSVRDVLNNLLQ